MIQGSDVCFTTSMYYMSLKVDVSRTKLIYVIFEFVLLRKTIIYLTKHRCIHVRNFVRKKNPIPFFHFVYVTWARGQLRINFTSIFKVFTKLPESRSDEGNLENFENTSEINP